jgi:hypothetical protein
MNRLEPVSPIRRWFEPSLGAIRSALAHDEPASSPLAQEIGDCVRRSPPFPCLPYLAPRNPSQLAPSLTVGVRMASPLATPSSPSPEKARARQRTLHRSPHLVANGRVRKESAPGAAELHRWRPDRQATSQGEAALPARQAYDCARKALQGESVRQPDWRRLAVPNLVDGLDVAVYTDARNTCEAACSYSLVSGSQKSCRVSRLSRKTAP